MHWRASSGWLLAAALFGLFGCGRQVTEEPVPAPVASEPAAAETTPTEFPTVGLKVLLPTGWKTLEEPDGTMGATIVGFGAGASMNELPNLQVSCYRPSTVAHIEQNLGLEKGQDLVDRMTVDMKEAMLADDQAAKAELVEEAEFTAPGLTKAQRVRIKGVDPARGELASDMVIGRAESGCLYVIVLSAATVEDLTALAVLDQLEFSAPTEAPAEESPHGAMGGDPHAGLKMDENPHQVSPEDGATKPDEHEGHNH